MQYTRIHRLLKILTLIQSASAWTPSRLAEECNADERTVYRDLDALRQVGIPIAFDRAAKTYRVDGDFFLPPVQLTPDEALALAVLCTHVAEREQIPFTRPAWRALSKIQAAMPAEVRDDIAERAAAIVVRTAAAAEDGEDESVYGRVQNAILTRRALVCRYDSLNPETNDEEFDFEPYVLFFAMRAWYVIGYHAERDDIRTLKLRRFTCIRQTERPYDIPKDFSLDAHLGNAWRMIRGTPDHDVTLRFTPEFAETIADTRWHHTQQIEHHDDGSATFRCSVAGLDEIAWWILSMGPHCTVIEPPELAARVRDAARNTAALYESTA